MNAILFLCTVGLHGAPIAPLEVLEAVVDRGEIRAGAILSQTFTLKNNGSAAITIAEVNPGCGCLRPRLSSRTIRMGESAELRVEINSLSQPAGANSWKVSLRYLHGSEPVREQDLVVKGKVVREIHVEPAALHVSAEGETTHTIQLTDRRANPLTLERAVCSSPHVKIQLTAVGVNAQGDRIQQVHVTVLGNCPPGHYSEVVEMRSSDANYPELRVPLMITRKQPGQLSVAPEQVTLRLAKGQNTASGLVRLRDSEDRAVTVERIETDHPALHARWAAGPGSMATLRVGVEFGEVPSSGLGTVTVHLKAPIPQRIVIPVTWQAP